MIKKSYFTALSGFALSTLLIFLTGCASSGLSSMNPNERVAFEKVMSENISPDQMVTQAQNRLQEAKEAELDFYAPASFKKASELVAEADALLLKKGAKPESVIIAAIKAKQQVDLGFETKEQVLGLLAIAISEKKLLDEINTQSIFPDEYASVMTLFRQMVDLIEEKKPEEATGLQPRFTKMTAALLIKTLDRIVLDESRKLLADARNKEARTYAPKTYVDAELKLKQAETFIRTYPRNREGIERVGKETLKAATHAVTITREVKMISAFETSTIEGFVLDIEQQIHTIGETLNQPEIPYDTLRAQLEGLKEYAASIAATAGRVPGLEQAKESLGTDLKAEREKTASLENKLTGLEVSLAGVEADKNQGEQANATLNQENTGLKTQLETLTQESTGLKSRIETLNQTLAEKKLAAEKLTSERDAALEETLRFRGTVTELEIRLKDAEKKLADADTLKTRLETLEKAKKSLEGKITELQSEKKQGLDEITDLKGTVKELKSRLESAAADLKQAEKEAVQAPANNS